MEFREYCTICLSVLSTFYSQLIWVGAESGLGLGLVSKVVVVFWAFVEISLHMTLESNGLHQFARFLHFILDNNQFVR